MPNIKTFIAYTTTSKTVYWILERLIDLHRLNDADGTYTEAPPLPADPYVLATEHTVKKGKYVLNENRSAWDNGLYEGTAYEQAGGSPAPVSDMVIAYQYMYIKSDAEVELGTTDLANINAECDTANTDYGANKIAPNTVVPDAAGVVNGLLNTKIPTALTFAGSDVKATLDGEEVTPTTASKTGYALSVAGILAIWNQLTNDVGIIASSFAKKLADWVVGTIDTYTGNTKQTGDVTTVINKLPTHYIMGSAVVTDKDDEIDAILEDTGTTLETRITDIKGTGFAKDTDSLVNLAHKAGTKGTDAIYDKVNAISVLTGASHVTLTFLKTATIIPLEGVSVTVRNSTDTETKGIVVSDANGVAEFNINDDTYILRPTMVGYLFDSITLIVSGDTEETYYGDARIPTPAPDPDIQTLTMTIRDLSGNPVVNCTVQAIPTKRQIVNDTVIGLLKMTELTDTTGYAELFVEKGSEIAVTAGADGEHLDMTITVTVNDDRDISAYD